MNFWLFELKCICEKALEMSIPEILWQLLIEKEFIWCLATHLMPKSDDHSTNITSRKLLNIEENAVTYIAGCVIRKLEERYCKQKTLVSKQYVEVLKSMGGHLKCREDVTEKSSNAWLKLVNIGVLYIVEDLVYDLSMCIEFAVNAKLDEIFNDLGKGIEQIKKENQRWVCENEDVQCVWNQICLDPIEDEEYRKYHLQEIAYLYVTTRGYSKAQKIKESYKLQQKQTLKGKKSLRKELEKCN
jgi:hypothetical protein